MSSSKSNCTLSTQIIIEEAQKRGYDVKVLIAEKNFLEISNGKKKIYIKTTNLPINNTLSAVIADDKELSDLVLGLDNIPRPKTIILDNLESIDAKIKYFKSPFVVKPLKLAHGIGVITNIENKKDLEKYAREIINRYGQVIIQEFITGNDYRLLVLDGKFISAVHRSAAKVVGDGRHTIKQLIDIENKNPLRGKDFSKPLVTIEIDKETRNVLKSNKYSLNTKPEVNKIIFLKNTANQSKGGDVTVVTNRVHDDYKKIAEKAANAVGLKVAGVDILCSDISKSYKDTRGRVIEINANPGIDMHKYPSSGRGDDIGKPFVDILEKYCF